MRIKLSGASWLAISCGLFHPAAALAQAATATPSQTPIAASEPQPLGDIVVTAERRSQSIQKSSLAIAVVSGEDLKNAGVSQARDLVKVSPGVIIGQGGPATQIFVRGVGDFSSTPVTNPAVSVYVDGAYIARSQSVEGNFYDLQRVEILKGPQGTLYGRNASGGAINLITNRPKLDQTSADFDFEVGNYDLVKADAAINLPIGHTLAVRLAGQFVRRSGYSTQGLDDDKHQSVRLQALWEPNSRLSLRLSADYSHIGGNGPAFVFKGVDSFLAAGLAARGIAFPTSPRANGTDPSVQAIYYGVAAVLGRCIPTAALGSARTSDGPAPITVGSQGACAVGQTSLISPNGNAIFGRTAYVNNKFWNVSGELNYDLPFAKLTTLVSYRDVANRYVAYPVITFDDAVDGPETSKSFSTEVRFSRDMGPLNLVVGGFYFDEKQRALTGGNAGLIIGNTLNQYAISTKSYAGFGQATYKIMPELRIIAGVRYSVDEKSIDGRNLTAYPGLPFIAGQPCFNKPTRCLRDTFIAQRTFKSPSFKAGVEYDVAPANMVYATVANGQKAGGFNQVSLPGTANVASSFDPEKLTAYELGSRNRFLNGRLQVNLEAFLWKYKDAQEFFSTTNASGNAVTALANAGRATLYGIDADIIARLTRFDTVTLAGEYLHTKFNAFVYTASGAIAGQTTGCGVAPGTPFSTIDCSGRPLPRAPRYTATASYRHRFELPGDASIDATATGQFSASRYLTVDYTPASLAAAYQALDLSLAYNASSAWSLTAFVRNVTNAKIYTGAFTVAALFRGLTMANLSAPRTYGAALRVHF